MKWIKASETKPKESYLVHINWCGGGTTFKATAYYEQGLWYSNDGKTLHTGLMLNLVWLDETPQGMKQEGDVPDIRAKEFFEESFNMDWMNEGERHMIYEAAELYAIGRIRFEKQAAHPSTIQQEGQEWNIPPDATNIECFCIKRGEAYIGYKLPNGNFHFIQIPYTGKDEISDYNFLDDPIYQSQKEEITQLQSLKEENERLAIEFAEWVQDRIDASEMSFTTDRTWIEFTLGEMSSAELFYYFTKSHPSNPQIKNQ